MPKRSGFAALIVLALSLAAEAKTVAIDQQALDALVRETAERYRLPGIAVGIVADGKAVYRYTQGRLRADRDAPIDADSLFKIASNSKPMTTAVLARLVERGALKWDDPVRNYLPGFRMADPWVAENMQVRDLLLHHSGLADGAGDLMLWPQPNGYTREDVIAALPRLKAEGPFRSHYGYSNLLYIVAGEVAAKASGRDFDSLLRDEVFRPLGMNRCRTGAWKTAAVGNVAQPHALRNGRNTVIRADGDWVPASTDSAAGGVRCSLNDMLAWMRAWLDPAPAWLSESSRQQLWQAQAVLPLGKRQQEWDGAHFHAYGYGWRRSDVHGQLKIAHTGSLAGMYSVLTLLPESGIGIVILINGDGASARTALNQALLDRFIQPLAAHSVGYYADRIEREASPDTAQPTLTALPQSGLTRHWGVYRDPWLGEMALCPEGGRTRFSVAKSARLTGVLKADADGRAVIDWDDASADEPILLFTPSLPGAGLSFRPLSASAMDTGDWQTLTPVRTAACPGRHLNLAESGLVDVRVAAPGLHHDIRYAGTGNFTGKRVSGYGAAKCLLHPPVARALADAEHALRGRGYALTVFDCYRPTVAVADFMRWAKAPDDAAGKAAYYPDLDKSALVPDYIAEKSGHSKGATADVGLLDCRSGACRPADMGTAFDFFGVRANTEYAGLSAAQKAARQILLQAMTAQGFVNYPLEWWHYTWKAGPLPDTAYDFPIE